MYFSAIRLLCHSLSAMNKMDLVLSSLPLMTLKVRFVVLMWKACKMLRSITVAYVMCGNATPKMFFLCVL